MRIKGFDKNLCCRGMQYEIGKEYTTEGKNLTSYDLCTNKVLHYCDSIQKVNNFYPCADNDNRYCEIEVLGEEVTDGDKYGSNHIKIVREIIGEELELIKGHINGNTGLFNKGQFNSGNYNSGNINSGNYNSGNRNGGHGNSGHRNSGDYNSGDDNSGNWNIGNCNNGDCNSGIFNSCTRSNGAFCTENNEKINLFNKPSGMTFAEFVDSKYYRAINSSTFTLTEWIEYTDEEKKESERKALDEGYLKAYTYKEACKNWWKNMTKENKKIVKSIPNFDAEVFEHITGIKV